MLLICAVESIKISHIWLACFVYLLHCYWTVRTLLLTAVPSTAAACSHLPLATSSTRHETRSTTPAGGRRPSQATSTEAVLTVLAVVVQLATNIATVLTVVVQQPISSLVVPPALLVDWIHLGRRRSLLIIHSMPTLTM